MPTANPYVVAYNGAAPFGAYMALYGSYGAQKAHAQSYKTLLHLMAKRIRLKKHLMRASGKKAAKIKNEIRMLNKHISHLKAQLAAKGQRAPSEQEAVIASTSMGSEAVTATSRFGSKRHRRGIRRLRNRDHFRRRVYPNVLPAPSVDAIAAGGGTAEFVTPPPVLTGQTPPWIHSRYSPHRARLPGQRQFDGRRRSGPISAQDVQTQDVSQDAPDDGDILASSTMGITASSSMGDEVADAADAALSGVMDFVGGVFDDRQKLLTYGAIGLGVFFLYKNMKKRR